MSARLHLEQASPQTRPARQELPETFAIDISSTSSTPMVMGGECPSRLLAGFRPGYAAVSNSESKPPPSNPGGVCSLCRQLQPKIAFENFATLFTMFACNFVN